MKLYTRRLAKYTTFQESHGIPYITEKPGGYLEHIDRGDGKTLCAFHRDSPALTNVPRAQVHRKCPRCIHLKEKANGKEAARPHR